MLVGNRLLAGFSAVAQTRQLSHTACSLSFAYFNARIFTTTKTRVRRGHLKWHFPVASARCQAEGRTNFIAPQAGSTAFRIRCSDSNAIRWSYELGLESRETIYIASIGPDTAFAAKSCASGKKSAHPTPFAADIPYSELNTQRGSLANSCGPRTGKQRPLDLATHL